MRLDARIVRPGMGAIPGVIRDMCPAGVFVAVDPLLVSRQEPIDPGESVQIHFSARYDGQVREFKLRARVADTFKHGVGCEFFDPESQALAALRQIAVPMRFAQMPMGTAY